MNFLQAREKPTAFNRRLPRAQMEIKGVIQPLAGKGQPAAAVGAGVVHLGGAQAGAVAALFKQMRLARHPGPVQGADQQQGVLHRDRLVLHGVPDEHRRGAGA